MLASLDACARSTRLITLIGLLLCTVVILIARNQLDDTYNSKPNRGSTLHLLTKITKLQTQLRDGALREIEQQQRILALEERLKRLSATKAPAPAVPAPPPASKKDCTGKRETSMANDCHRHINRLRAQLKGAQMALEGRSSACVCAGYRVLRCSAIF